VGFLKRRYAPVLSAALKHPWLFTLPAIVLLTLAVVGLTRAGRTFLPEFNEGSLTISAVTLPGTALTESDELGRVVEKVLLNHPEVQSVARRTGRAELDEHAQGVEASELDVRLKMQKRSKDELLEALRTDLSQVPGVNITIGQPISHRIDHMLSGTRANIAIKIFGDDLSRLRTLGEKARQVVSAVPGAVDVGLEQQMEIPTLRVVFDRNSLAHYGLQVRDVAQAMEAALQGTTVSRVLEGRTGYDLVLRVAGSEPWRTDTLGELLVDGPDEKRVPLSALASIRKETAPNTISREQVERKIVVSCNVAGRDLASVVADCRKAVDPIVNVEKGYRAEYGGQFESAEHANRLLLLLGIGVVIGIALILRTAFGSTRDAAFVMVNLPLALIGGVLGVFLSGSVLSVASLVGFITVFGIAARNGIMLVSHIRHLQEKEGVTDFHAAVFRGSMERLAPILMTALAAGLALIPLALGGGKPGNEIQTPMAIVILCGLLTSMVLNMIIVPALYLRFGRPVSQEAHT
jgi:Cu/Ag efflux pump CusA